MSYPELIHRYFDEGLDDATEDVLFERLAIDADLRREFAGHMKIQTFVKQDIMNITTPAALTSSVFARLGVPVPADAVPAAAANAPLSFATYIPYAVTALLTASLTLGAFLLFFPEGTPPHVSSLTSTQPPGQRSDPAAPEPAISPDYSGTRTPSLSTGTNAPEEEAASEGFAAIPPVEIVPDPQTDDVPAQMFIADPGTPKLPELKPANPAVVPDDRVALAVLETPPHPPQKYFFSHSPSILSNIVLEMRFLNSSSHPNVNLPYNDDDLFKDLAFSAIYKVSDYHAVGLEYGRETFGQEFASVRQVVAEESEHNVLQIYNPPLPWIAGIYHRNIMLDWFGVVWKTSFPDLGFMNLIYPYTRTVLGGTREGMLGKFRLGFEMYPTHFSSLSVGVEGAVLKYQVEDVWYQTNKLGWTAGVAIGF